MKKIFILLTLSLVLVSGAFASDNLLYSYDYNRYYTEKTDVLIAAGYQYKVSDYAFRNLNTFNVNEKKLKSSGFTMEVTERRNKFSFYENADFVQREITMNNVIYKVNSTSVRFGAVKDFFIENKFVPLTASVGGGIVGKINWFSQNQNIYNNFSVYLGLSLKAQANIHLSSLEGRYNIFLSYQPDIYLINNIETGKLAFVDKFMMDQSLSCGVQIKIL